MNELINILLVEDNAADARYVQELLPSSKYAILLAGTLASGLALLNSELDVVLLDLSLPDSLGLQTFDSLNLKAPEIPIIVLTGLNDDEIATEAVKLGAQDYLRMVWTRLSLSAASGIPWSENAWKTKLAKLSPIYGWLY